MEDLSSNPFDSQFHSKQEYSSKKDADSGFNGDIQDLPSNSSNYTLNSTNNTDMVSDVNNISNQGLNNLSDNNNNNYYFSPALSDKMNEMGEELID